MNETTNGMPPKTANESFAHEVAKNEPTITEPSAPIEAPRMSDAPPTTVAPFDGLRLRVKVWTDPTTTKRYLMPTAFMRDVMNGQPVTDAMLAYAMCDDDTKLVTLTASEWNSLPFYYFKEDGWAPRAAERPVDVVG